MNNMQRLNKFLEIFWLVVSIVSIILLVYVYTNIGFEDNLILLFFPIISVGMYVLRRSMSKRYKDQQ